MSESRTIEASGPDIEAAITKGVSDLGVSRADVIVEILEEPGGGLLGLGAKPAKVRLTLIRAPKIVEPITVPASSATGQSEQSIERAPSAGAKPPARASHDDIDDAWEEDGILSDSELAEDARVGAETLRELLGFLQMDARVIASRAESEDDEAQHWTLEIQGRDLGALIGRRGETLAALQYITRLIASRDLERRAHIVIDVEGYKARRETLLRRLAKRMAEPAVQRGRTVSLEPMPPHERRIIHLALRDNPDVTTESVGERDRRKVTIVPRRPQ